MYENNSRFQGSARPVDSVCGKTPRPSACPSVSCSLDWTPGYLPKANGSEPAELVAPVPTLVPMETRCVRQAGGCRLVDSTGGSRDAGCWRPTPSASSIFTAMSGNGARTITATTLSQDSTDHLGVRGEDGVSGVVLGQTTRMPTSGQPCRSHPARSRMVGFRFVESRLARRRAHTSFGHSKTTATPDESLKLTDEHGLPATRAPLDAGRRPAA